MAANVIIHSEERRENIRRTLLDYGVDPACASREQKDMADCISCKTDEAVGNMRKGK